MSELTDLFTNIANAIRAKSGATGQIAATSFAESISNLPAGPSYVVTTEYTTHLSSSTIKCPAIIGKENVVVYANANFTIADAYSNSCVLAMSVGENKAILIARYERSVAFGDNVTYDPKTGTITASLFNRSYTIIAW